MALAARQDGDSLISSVSTEWAEANSLLTCTFSLHVVVLITAVSRAPALACKRFCFQHSSGGRKPERLRSKQQLAAMLKANKILPPEWTT